MPVAWHSLVVAAACRGVGRGTELEALLHDGAEACVGEWIRPLRHRIGKGVFELHDRIQAVVFEAAGLPPNGGRISDTVHAADNMACRGDRQGLGPRARHPGGRTAAVGNRPNAPGPRRHVPPAARGPAAGRHEDAAQARRGPIPLAASTKRERRRDDRRTPPGREKAGIPCGEDRGRTAARPQGLQIPLHGRGKDHGIGGQIAAHAAAPQGRAEVGGVVLLHAKDATEGARGHLEHAGAKTNRNSGVTGRANRTGGCSAGKTIRKRQNERPDRKRNRRGARPANGRPARGCARRHGPNAKTAR